MIQVKRPPTTPGEILDEEFLQPLGMTQKQLADHIGCDIKVINRLVNGKTGLSAEIALKLAATFKTTPEFWINAQQAVDLYEAFKAVKKLPPPYKKAVA
jgi:addiction module HigA family antidote